VSCNDVIAVIQKGLDNGCFDQPVLKTDHYAGSSKVAGNERPIGELPPRLDFWRLAYEQCFGYCMQPDGNRLRSWIGMAEHTIPKITGPP
jgi:hypothetical protein